MEEHGYGPPQDAGLHATEKEAVEIELKYSGLAERQRRMQAQVVSKHSRRLPSELDYNAINTLSKEAREKLSRVCGPNLVAACMLAF